MQKYFRHKVGKESMLKTSCLISKSKKFSVDRGFLKKSQLFYIYKNLKLISPFLTEVKKVRFVKY